MINIPVWMFLSSYEKLRESLIAQDTFANMVHFGRGVFGSDFGTTAFVIAKVISTDIREHIVDCLRSKVLLIRLKQKKSGFSKERTFCC